MEMGDKASPLVAIIGGSGFYSFPELTACEDVLVQTPYGDDVQVRVGLIGESRVAFIARHGSAHKVPPHKINYRANVWALRQVGAKQIVALNAVGGIASSMPPGAFLLPDQVVDYTYGREHTFADELSTSLNHIDFTHPFSDVVRSRLSDAFSFEGVECFKGGVYGCTQGPRLESAAEIIRLKQDGCDVVGMTGMPEAALARELGLEYAMICTVVNWGAGLSPELITFDQIRAIIDKTNPVLRRVLSALMNNNMNGKE